MSHNKALPEYLDVDNDDVESTDGGEEKQGTVSLVPEPQAIDVWPKELPPFDGNGQELKPLERTRDLGLLESKTQVNLELSNEREVPQESECGQLEVHRSEMQQVDDTIQESQCRPLSPLMPIFTPFHFKNERSRNGIKDLGSLTGGLKPGGPGPDIRGIYTEETLHDCRAELEQLIKLALNGSDDEKISADTIPCGSSLVRGWNVQEHTAYFITRLLSPSVSADYSRANSHLIAYAQMLKDIVGIASVDCIQIFSLHGLVPQLVGSWMPIGEVSKSCVPTVSWTLTTGEVISSHAVFSNAVALLLRLWRFNYSPLECGVGDVPPVGSQLTPHFSR
ncbi:hypothetical protein Nepgr_023711 [Nepenthes gracilis]|uniref:Uncharacterized protein n=1 Tax=Nepenthes gracilis TaxID=150966 RepID=A0AAD3XY37_NEPGR|nr:hypothetical protein Nepgr_023711 [Nepenthes gracilis]